MGQGRHTLRSVSDPVYPLNVSRCMGAQNFIPLLHHNVVTYPVKNRSYDETSFVKGCPPLIGQS